MWDWRDGGRGIGCGRKDSVLAVLRAIEGVGYEPRLPVKIQDFADPETRRRWVEERNMVVFQLWSDRHRETPIDVFVREPFDFEEAWQEAVVKEDRGVSIPVLDVARMDLLMRAVFLRRPVTLSSLVPHPSSLVCRPSSVVPHPSSLIPHPSSLIPRLPKNRYSIRFF